MKIFSLSLFLFPDYTHTHTHHFSKLVWRDITRSTIPAKSILPRISKPFVYLEPPFHYLETARFFFLSRKREHRKQEGEGDGLPSRSRLSFWLFVHPVKYLPLNHDRLRSSFCSFCSTMKRTMKGRVMMADERCLIRRTF